MRESLGWVSVLALLLGLVLAAVAWQQKTALFFVPLALFVAAFVLGFLARRTQTGKFAYLGGLVGMVLWGWRIGWVISEELGSIWRNG